MRYLDLLRHAKTEPDNDNGDAARCLTETGRAAAAALHADLRALDPQPGYILCSSATRARQTMDIVRSALPGDAGIEMADSLYNAGTGTIYELIKGLPDHHTAAVLIGHNPGLSQIVNFLSATPLELKPGDYVRLQLDIDQWASAMPGAAQLIAHFRPKDRV